ncbi:MAG: hypothetical protein GXO18_06280 [Aquificae bacterium]|nr:hypothetical protein [Aquificota bacterium]
MRKLILSLLLGSSLLLSSCAELALLTAGAVAGGAAGYYAGKEGYKVKVEKED